VERGAGGTLLIDPSAGATLTFNTSDFDTYTQGLGGKINFLLFNMGDYPTPLGSSPQSVYAPEIGKTDAALTSFTIAPETLTNGQVYILQVNYTHIESTNTTDFTGTGISGSPLGMTYDTTTTFIMIEAVPEPSSSGLLIGGAMGALGLRRHAVRRKQRAGSSL
jgi:PEP-CTERM motif